MTHSPSELQSILSGQIDRLVDGEATPASVNAVVNSTSGVVRIWKQKMDYARQVGRTPHIPELATWDDSEDEAASEDESAS